MRRIRITSVPSGQAPEWVREQWLGLELPVKDVQLSRGVQGGVLGGPPEPENVNGYPVDTMRAVAILATKSQKAAQWWADNLNPRTSALVFGKQFCELLE